jgi:hypothetical protein
MKSEKSSGVVLRVQFDIVLEGDVYGLPLLRAKPEERVGVRRNV